ncbi:TonB-dependent siderophore receptor [Flavobacterium qiangtangense]|uniref:TonB-dependent siderophore receptor n=1 Tax=Flavobacterium qiangtangense TaxID=1442595 RepID=A0ABW1PHH7_9FLAO
MNKSILTFLASVFCVAISFAQNGTLNGKIVSSDNLPLEAVTVTVNGTKFGTQTDSQGNFEIKNLKSGNYTLKTSFVGFKTREITFSITENQTTTLEDVALSSKAETLDEVVLNGTKTNPYARKESAVVSKMPLKDIENPQVYNTISSELLKEQVVTNFDDALKNAPGIDKLWESTGRGSDGAGYFSLRGFAVQPTMVNGLPSLTNGSPDPANIERIEVIKGPSGTLFGSSLISYGGLINVTTKRPYNSFGGSVSYVGGTYGLNRVAVDVNTPLSTEKNVAMRVNAAYHSENSFQDAGFRKSLFIAPSLSYEVNDKLSFLINTEFYNGKSTNQTMLFLDRGAPLRVHNLGELGYDNKRSYTSNDLFIETPSFNLQGQMNYKINDQWTSQTVISRTSSKSEGYYSYLYEGTQYTPVTDGIVLARYTSNQNSESIGTDIQQNFIGDFKIGSLRNRLIVGFDYYNMNVVNNGSSYVQDGYVYIGNNLQQFNESVLGITDPTLYTDDSGTLSQAGVDGLLAGSPRSASKTKQEIYSAYASNVLNITPALSVMTSLRVDRFINNGDLSTTADDYNQTALSPKFGVVFQPILDKVSVFANFMNGFSNVAPITTPGNNIFTFDPEQANQLEVGTKLNLLNDKLTAGLSFYTVKVSNTVLQVSPEEYIQDGEQTNKGFEANITASPIAGLNIIAGYSYNDSKLEKAAEGNEFANRRPESAGPQNLANLWATYKILDGKLQGFGLGFGGNYGSENKIFNRNGAGAFTLPDYTVINGSLFYSSNDFLITLKLDNITNKEYYKGWSTISPQRPRIFSIGATYNF